MSLQPCFSRLTVVPTMIVAENKIVIVQLGGLEPLIRQMLSTNVEVQCNAVGCITNLATHDENKTKIAKSGALVPLTRLARSKDMRVQRNATGQFLFRQRVPSSSELMLYPCRCSIKHDAFGREPDTARQCRRYPRSCHPSL